MLKFILSVAAAFLSLAGVIQANAYDLGAQDKIRIRIVEWTASRAKATNWDMLGGEYVVGADGNVVLPLLGPLPVAGITPERLAERIGEELELRYGLQESLSAAVEVIEYRPVFVLGGVANPGAFPYRPGLTVLQAVSLAGGLYRGGEMALQLQRDAITSGGDLQMLRLQRVRLLAREARLRTELAGEPKVEMTDTLAAGGVDENVLADENALLDARSQSLTSQTEAISRLQQLLEGELDAIQRKIGSENRLLQLSREELQSVGGLVDRGLAVSSRQREMVRIVAETESRLIDLQTLELRARQEMSRAQRDLLQIQTQHHADIVRELQDTQAQLSENAVRQTTSANVLDQVANIAPAAGSLVADTGEAPSIAYTVLRVGCSGGWSASAETELQPGDTLQVSREDSPSMLISRSGGCSPTAQAAAKEESAETRTN